MFADRDWRSVPPSWALDTETWKCRVTDRDLDGVVTRSALRYAHRPPSLQVLQARPRSSRIRRLTELCSLVSVVAFLGWGWSHSSLTLVGAVHEQAETSAAASVITSLSPFVQRAGMSASLFTNAPPAPTATPRPAPAFIVGTSPDNVSSIPDPAQPGASQSILPNVPGLGTVGGRIEQRTPVAPQAAQVIPRATSTPRPYVRPLDVAGLTADVKAATADAQGRYSVYVIDLSSGQTVNIVGLQSMNAASVDKLEILGTVFHLAELGKINMDGTMRLTGNNIQDYGTGVIRYDAYGTTYTVSELCRLLIEYSDNTASYMLASLAGAQAIDSFDANWGLSATDVMDDTSSARDAARFLQFLYEGKLMNAQHTQTFVDYLTHTVFNDRIPAGLPDSVLVAHKIGTQVGVINDAGIIYLQGRPYILSIFSEQVDEDAAPAVEQRISKIVLEYEVKARGAS